MKGFDAEDVQKILGIKSDRFDFLLFYAGVKQRETFSFNDVLIITVAECCKDCNPRVFSSGVRAVNSAEIKKMAVDIKSNKYMKKYKLKKGGVHGSYYGHIGQYEESPLITHGMESFIEVDINAIKQAVIKRI